MIQSIFDELNWQPQIFIILGLGLTSAALLVAYVLKCIRFNSLNNQTQKNLNQKSLLSSALNNLKEGVTILDAQGELIYRNHIMEIPQEKRPLNRALAGEVLEEVNLTVTDPKTGNEVKIISSVMPLYNSLGVLIGAMAQYQDVTETKKMEVEWQKSREIVIDSTQFKAEFLTQMGYEIRTPMNGILAMAKWLLKSSLNSEQENYVKNIKVSAHYLLNMIQRFLDQFSYEKGEIRLESAAFSLSDAIQHVINILEPVARDRNVNLFLDTEIEHDLEVVSDSIRLQEILMAVLEKAIMQTENGFVSLKVQVLEVFEGKARFYFEIKNSNSKISQGDPQPDQLKSLLHKEIVRQFDGEMDSEFIEGGESRYTLTLDLKLKKSDESKIVKRHTQIISDKPILVAEDQELNQMVIEKYLERFGLRCHIVADGQTAFLEATTGKYCMVLMDCNMEPIDGYEATQLIRTHEKRLGSRIPIVALTADGSHEGRRRCERVGMDDYIVKPIDIDQIESILQKWIQPVLKEEYIKKLDGYKMEGKPLLQFLAEDYFTSVPTIIEKVEESIENNDLKKVQYYAHTLKSCSITLGLVELSSYCEKLEYITNLEPLARLILKQIKHSYKKSAPILRRRIMTDHNSALNT